MRALFSLIVALVGAALIAALAIFAAQNITGVPLRFLGWGFGGSIWWIAVASALLGFVLAFLLLAPGRVMAGWRGRGFRLRGEQLEQELATQRAQHAQLQEEHERLQAEYRQVAAEREQVRAERRATETDRTQVPTGAAPAPVAAEQGVSPAQERLLVPPARPVASTVPPASDATPTLGERVRSVFQRPDTPKQDETRYPTGPTAPTA